MRSDADKTTLRDAALTRRRALSETERASAAQAIASRAFPVAVPAGAIVSGYRPIRGEIDPVPLMTHLATRGAQLALPVVIARNAPLSFRVWRPDDILVRGAFGICEPTTAAAELEPDIVLVPLAAFDRAGHRIGYGAGHYDRTLARLRTRKTVVAIGVAFAVQEVAAVPAEPHDVPLDYVLTEIRTLDFRRL